MAVTTNNYEYNEVLLQIDKTSNYICIGAHFYDETTEELKLETMTLLSGKVAINNYSGLQLVNGKDNTSTRLINHVNDVFFVGDYKTPNNTTDIILSKGLRSSITEDALIFHKSRDTINDNYYSQHAMVFPFQTDLIDWENVCSPVKDIEELIWSVAYNLNPRIEALEEHYEYLNDGVENFEGKIEELVDDLGQLETAVIGINDRVKTLEEGSGSGSENITLQIDANDVSMWGGISLYTWAEQQVENIADTVYNAIRSKNYLLLWEKKEL
jgi:hypothetical protein